MNEQTTHSKSVLGILHVLLVLTLLSMSATPSQAQWWNCWWGCWPPPDPEPEPEPVEPTGVTHVIYMVGDGFMPDLTHAQLGDTITFYQLAYANQKVEADDGSWTSQNISRNNSWSFMIDHDTGLDFKKRVTGWYSSTNMTGEIVLEDVPDVVNLGDLIDHEGNIIGKDGTSKGLATGLGYTLAGVNGVVKNLGKGLGLNTDLGLGNN